MMKINKLVMGCAQIGFNYGVTNTVKDINDDESHELLNNAYSFGIRSFDTAMDYNKSEERLGNFVKNYDDVNVFTKISFTDEELLLSDELLSELTLNKINDSFLKLQKDRIDILFLHEMKYLKRSIVLETIKQSKGFDIIGCSINDFEEIMLSLQFKEIQAIQLSFNILDIEKINTIKMLKEKNIQVYARSIFLQGILLQNDISKWPKGNDNENNKVFNLINRLSDKLQITKNELCTRYVLSYLDIFNGIIIGLETVEQIKENVKCFEKDSLALEQLELIHTEVRNCNISTRLISPWLW